MSHGLLHETRRAREIVVLAAKMAKNRPLQIWLRNDEYGTWEKTAKEMLAKVPARLAEKNLTLSDQQINEEIAHVIYGMGLEAMLRDAKKRGK